MMASPPATSPLRVLTGEALEAALGKEGVVAFDNTTLSAYRRCFRYGAWKHERGFSSLSFNKAANFGIALHASCDVIWAALCRGPSQRVVSPEALAVEAFQAWEKKWVSLGGPMGERLLELEDEYAPYLPKTAQRMIQTYIRSVGPRLASMEIVSTELPFAVPLWPDDERVLYVGLIDKVVRVDGRLRIYDHKTTSQYDAKQGFRSSWSGKFVTDAQTDGYFYAASLLYPGVEAAYIDALLVHKDVGVGNKYNPALVDGVFRFLPLVKTAHGLNEWLLTVRELVARILAERVKAAAREWAFPMNDNGCFQYGSLCPYIGMCAGAADWQTATLPADMKVDFWRPVDLLNKLKGDGE